MPDIEEEVMRSEPPRGDSPCPVEHAMRGPVILTRNCPGASVRPPIVDAQSDPDN